jgi:hypothetical protein
MDAVDAAGIESLLLDELRKGHGALPVLNGSSASVISALTALSGCGQFAVESIGERKPTLW